MKPFWQRQQEQWRRIRRQQEQMRRQQERMRMGAAWLEQQRRRQLEEGRGLRPSYAAEEGPSCIGRLVRAFLYLLLIAIVFFALFICLVAFLGSSF
jgi:hypothetical protein